MGEKLQQYFVMKKRGRVIMFLTDLSILKTENESPHKLMNKFDEHIVVTFFVMFAMCVSCTHYIAKYRLHLLSHHTSLKLAIKAISIYQKYFNGQYVHSKREESPCYGKK